MVAVLSDVDEGDTTPFAVSIVQSSDTERITKKFPRTPFEPVSKGASVVMRLSMEDKSMSPFPPVHALESVAGLFPENENRHVFFSKSNST